MSRAARSQNGDERHDQVDFVRNLEDAFEGGTGALRGACVPHKALCDSRNWSSTAARVTNLVAPRAADRDAVLIRGSRETGSLSEVRKLRRIEGRIRAHVASDASGLGSSRDRRNPPGMEDRHKAVGLDVEASRCDIPKDVCSRAESPQEQAERIHTFAWLRGRNRAGNRP